MDGPSVDATPSDPPLPEETWAGLRATAMQAMEWGIDLCGQLAIVHREGELIGRIGPETIGRTRFGQPRLPEPDTRADHEPWRDVAALADAVRSIVEDPPAELIRALLPPYASAVALGKELQDAQRAMGLPVAPIPFDGAPIVPLGGVPLEVPPTSEPDVEETRAADGRAALDELGFDPGDLSRTPNLLALLAIAIMVAIAALALGVGWR